jgi:4,5-dihydroxyphthalate decarboxylase
MVTTKLKTVLRAQGNVAALMSGRIAPAGWQLDFHEEPVLTRAFRDMVRYLSYDVCEMSFTTYLLAKAHGKPFTALPVFLMRDFHHRAINVNLDADIQHPKDLEGRMVGVNRGYTVTTGVWARGIMATEYGVDIDAVTWVISDEEHVAEYQLPHNVIRVRAGTDLAQMVASGELAAVVGVSVDHPRVARLIADADDVGFDALRTRGHYPINHLVVVKDDVLERHADLAPALLDAFTEAKDRYVEKLCAGAIEHPDAHDRRYLRVSEITGADPLPYGVTANRAMIDELIDHALNQHILSERPALDSLFL